MSKPVLKNTYSTSTRVFDDIQKTLREHKAKQVTFDYDDNGRIVAISFKLAVKDMLLAFRMPARIENVERIFLRQSRNYALSATQKEQAYRTAWANIRDWLAAQMALIDTEMVSVEEIFLPYMLSQDGQTTYFESLREQHFLLPEPGTVHIEEYHGE